MLAEFNKLKSSEEFLKWHSKNKDAYLASCFLMVDREDNDKLRKWQFDFYLRKLNKMTSFIVNEKIEIQEEEEIFKKSKNEIRKLDLRKVKINFERVLKIINKKHKEKFSKKIIILQNMDKPFWNISLLDDSLNITNIKIDAVTGRILSEKKENLFRFKAS